jgi:hypothetical protein
LPGRVPKALRDGDALPEKISVSEVMGALPAHLVITKSQAKEAQTTLRNILKRPETQRRLDGLEKEASNQIKYRAMLKSFLVSTVYPEVCQWLGLSDIEGIQAAALITSGIQAHTTMSQDVSMLQTWHELETLMRNKAAAAMAEQAVKDALAAKVGKETTIPAGALGA